MEGQDIFIDSEHGFRIEQKANIYQVSRSSEPAIYGLGNAGHGSARDIATIGDNFTHQMRWAGDVVRSEEHTSELQSLMRISFAVFCLKKTTTSFHRCDNIVRDND